MAQKAPKKKFNLNIDEEKDIFLSSLNKKIRNARKKIEAIEELEKKDRSTLKPEQLEKIKSRAEVLETIKYNESIKDLYYSALKTAQDEGKTISLQQESQVPRKVTEEDKTEPAAQPRTEEPKQQAPVEPARTQEDNSRIIRETLSKVLNLVHFAQLFRDQSSVQGFRQAFDSHRDQFALESVPDFESFHEFFVKVFTFSESDRFGKVGDKINGALAELESYINAAEQPALRNKTYRHLQTVVESVAKAPFFLNHNVEVEVPKARTVAEPSAIGSELRKGHEHQEAPVEAARPVQQEKVRSPEKETRPQPEAPKTAEKAAPQEEARKDWGSLEDEEEEEQPREEIKGETGAEEEEAQPAKEEQKEDDGFISVKPKYKEKKEETTGYRGSGTRPYRGGRGGYKGGERGGRGGYQRREGEEGQEGGYRRPRRDDQQEGGEGAGEGQRGGYRGRGEGRGGRGGYRGRGEGRGGRGGYQRREGENQGNQGERATGTEGVRTEQ